MLICRDCGRVAPNDPMWTTLSAETIRLSCPECGSEDVVTAAQCAHCHNWYEADTLCITADKEGHIIEVCPDCYEEFYFVPPKVGELDVL